MSELISEEIRNKILENIGRIVKARAMRLAPIDMGYLRTTIGYRIEGNTVIIFCGTDYAKDLEYGKPPEPLTKQEKEDVEAWAKRHRLPGKGVIYGLEHKGIKAGTPEMPYRVPNGTYRPFMRPALLQSRSEIKDMIKEVLS